MLADRGELNESSSKSARSLHRVKQIHLAEKAEMIFAKKFF
jgi:hypothetical protein